MNASPSNIFQILVLLERYHHNCQAVLAATGMDGFINSCLGLTENLIFWIFALKITEPIHASEFL